MTKDKPTILMERRIKKYFKGDYSSITKEGIDAFFLQLSENSNYTTARSHISVLNKIFRREKIDIVMSINDYNIKSRGQTKGIYSLEEVELAIDNLINPIDKFIVLAVFNGITGHDYNDILNLKKTDIDLDNSTINVNGRIVVMDKVFMQVTIDTLNQVEYAYFTSSGDTKYYEFNTASEYVVRPKPLKRNKQGLEPMGLEGFKTRFKNTVKFIGLETTVSTLEKSGYIHKLRTIKDDWKVNEVRDFIKANHMNVEGYNLLRLYNNFYGKIN